MSVKIISRKLEPRDVVLKLVDGTTIKGRLNLHHDEAVIQRVSEIFTKLTDPFITIFEATVEGKTNRVVIVNKSNIIWVLPEEVRPPG